MGIWTEAYEVDDPRYYEELGRKMDNRSFNGSTKLITALLGLLNILMAAGVVGLVMMYGRVQEFDVKFTDLDHKVEMIIEGRIRIPDGFHEHTQ